MRRKTLPLLSVSFLALIAVAVYLAFAMTESSSIALSNIPKPGFAKPTNKNIPFQYRYGAWLDENGAVAPDGILDAISQRDLYLAAHRPTDGFGDDGVARALTWVPRGPQNVGGRTRSIVVDPNNSAILYAGAVSGGIFKSIDRGKTWAAMNNLLSNFNVNCLAIEPGPGRGTILYAGTGEGFAGPGLRGGGVFKSTDGGMTWNRLEQSWLEKWAYVNSIAVSNSVILAAVTGGNGSEGHRGIMRSTNGGETWSKEIDASSASFVGFDPSDPSIAIAATCDDENVQCKVYRSTSGGASWQPSNLGDSATPLPSPSPFVTSNAGNIVEFAFQPSGGSAPSIIYAQHNPPGSPTHSIISKSLDGGLNFSSYGLSGTPEGVSGYTSVLWVSPTSTESIVLGGNAYLWRSMNGAQSFDVTKSLRDIS